MSRITDAQHVLDDLAPQLAVHPRMWPVGPAIGIAEHRLGPHTVVGDLAHRDHADGPTLPVRFIGVEQPLPNGMLALPVTD